MARINSGLLTRIAAPFCKFTLALGVALGIASAVKAADNVWEGDDDGYWETEANWTNPSGDYWKIDGAATSKSIKFKTQASHAYNFAIAIDGVTFSGDDANCGLNQSASDVRIGTWAYGSLTIESGSHAFNELAVPSAWWGSAQNGDLTVNGGSLTVNNYAGIGTGNAENASGAVGNINVNGGSVTFSANLRVGDFAGGTGNLYLNSGTVTTAGIYNGGGTGSIVFNGGTAVATTAAGGDFIPAAANYTVVVNNNGGTINNANNISISAAITGAGWLTKTGAGTLSLSNVAGFTGRIAVAENAGSVTLPATATNIKVGANTTKEVTENGIVFTYSATDYSNADNYWTGNGTGNDWATAGNWDTGLVGANNYVFHSGTLFGNAVSVEFAEAYTGDGSLYIQNGTDGVVTFSKASGAADTAGISLSGGVNIGTSDLGSLKLESGTYSAGWMDIGTGAGAAKLTISGGDMVVSGEVQIGRATDATATVDMTGGSLVAKSYLALSRGAGNLTGPTGIKTTFNLSGGEVRHTAEAGNWTHLSIGAYNAPGSTADFNVTGGELSGATDIYVGENHKGSLNVSGTGVVTTPANIKLGVESNGDGTLTLGADGSVTCAAITIGSGSASVTLSGGTLVAGADGTFIPASDKLTVTVDGNATLNTNGKTITIDAAMLGDGTLTCVGGGTVTFTSLDSTCTIVQAEDGTIVNKPEAYYWIGGASGDWNDGNNWSRSNDGAAAGAYPSTLTDTVVVGTAATLNLTGNVVVHEVIASAEVVLTGGKSLGFVTMRGDGLVTMSNVTFTVSGEDSTPFVINSNICVAKGTQNTFACSTLKNYLYGNLYGSGFLGVYSGSNNTSGGLVFCGDNSGFSGELDCYNNNSPMNEMGFSSDAAASENAVWNIKSRSSNKRSMGVYQDGINETSFLQTGGYYKFGALNGYLQTGDAGPMTIEVGARDDVACSVTYRGRGTTSKGNTRYVNIVKVGTNVFTVVNDTSYVNNFGDITIKGGVLSLPGVPNYGSFVTFAGEGATLRPTSGELDFSARIKNSTSAIIIDDSLGGSATWNTALDSSNNGGLVKDGYGTLTLTKVPQYSGATVVKDGKLVVPFGTKFESLTLDGDASVEVDMTEAVPNAVAFSSGRFIGDASKVTLVNIPDGYTVQNIGSADNIIYGNGSTTYTWAGPTSTFVNEVETSDYAWETETNWTPNGVPGSLDVVVFGTAAPKFTLASDVSVMSVVVNGEGGFSYSADHALAIIGNFDVATAGTLEISGAGSLEVNGIVSGVTDVKMTPQPATSAIIAAHPYYTEKFRSGYDLNLAALTGGGTIQSDSDQTVTIADGTSTFYGTLSGAMGIVKEGAGTLELQGPNKFTGDVVINGGALALSVKDYSSLIAYNFDASDTSKWSLTGDNEITLMQGASGWAFKSVGSSYATLVNDPAVFDGKTVMYLPATAAYRYNTDNKDQLKNKRAFSVFTVYQASSLSGLHYLHYYGYSNSSTWDAIRLNGSSWESRTFTTDLNWALYLDGGRSRTAVANKKSVVSLIHEYAFNDQRNDQIGKDGSGFDGYVAEVVGLNQTVSIEHRASIDAYLMQKWGCADATSCQFIPSTANVTMKSGATLDLGGMQQTVKSFTGAGTVANGSLKTTGDLTVDGGTLTIQATAGQTYVLSDVEAERLVLTGDAKGYTVKVPDNGRIVGRFVVPEGISVGFEGEGADVTVVNAPKGWEITSKQITGGILYRVGSFPFKLILR